MPLTDESAPTVLVIETVADSLPSFTESEIGLKIAVPVIAPAAMVMSDI